MLRALRGYRQKAILSALATSASALALAAAAGAAWGGAAAAAVAAAGFAAIAGVGFVHDRRLRRAVAEVAGTAEGIALGDLGRRASVATGDELESLASALNRMADRLVEQRAILHGIEAAILLIDLDRRVVWHNATAAQWFSLDGASGPRCYAAAFGREAPCPACLGAACFAANASLSTDVVRHGPDGIRHYHVTGSPVRGSDGTITGVLELIQDVTERRALEAQLRESESLARVGELAATVAHEIKNPLAGIRAGLELVARDLEDGSRGAAAVPRLLALIDRLNASVRDLLAFARPSPLRLGPCPLGPVLDDAVALVRASRPVARVAIRREAPPADLVVRADPAALRQVLVNLVLNAAEAMEQVPPERAEIVISVARADGAAVVAVRDRGPGFPPEARAGAFKPFFTTKPGGTGLGLALCRRLVEGHGGTIEIDAAPGGGAAVRVRIPLGEGAT